MYIYIYIYMNLYYVYVIYDQRRTALTTASTHALQAPHRTSTLLRAFTGRIVPRSAAPPARRYYPFKLSL